MIDVDKQLSGRKADLLQYFRERAVESVEDVRLQYGATGSRERLATSINKASAKTERTLIESLLQIARLENWSNEELLNSILMVKYAYYVVAIETRNEVWPYEYMSLSRRIGELWEPFCKLCFLYPISSLVLFVPPLFSTVKRKLMTEFENYVNHLDLTEEQRNDLKRYYGQVWRLVVSGEIKLELDLHFQLQGKRFVVDFKSGFGSNEKGNLNRLLLVATAYQILEEGYNCVILVRSAEEATNNYFQVLRKSGVWYAYCGNDAYERIREYSGFDLRQWISANVDWTGDLKESTVRYFAENNLTQYLQW